MIAWLNQNQGVLGLISIIVAVFGFFITNKNINKKYISQNVSEHSKGMQAGRDAIDNSENKKY